MIEEATCTSESCLIELLLLPKFKLYLFYNDYETSYTTYIDHASWHRCLRSGGLRVGGNRSTRRKLTCLTWWLHDHLTWYWTGSQWWEASALPLRQPDSLMEHLKETLLIQVFTSYYEWLNSFKTRLSLIVIRLSVVTKKSCLQTDTTWGLTRFTSLFTIQLDNMSIRIQSYIHVQ